MYLMQHNKVTGRYNVSNMSSLGLGCVGRGCSACRPEGVSDSTWKCEVGGGPIAVGRDSASS